MKFSFTTEEALPVAKAVVAHYKKRGFRIKAETAIADDAPCRTTLCWKEGALDVLVEAQGELSFSDTLRLFALWLGSKRWYAEFYIATHPEASTKVSVLAQMENHGVGLMLVEDDRRVVIARAATNPALLVTPDPNLRYGDCKEDVLAAVGKFNQTNRKDGLRDMCELVERETGRLVFLAAKKGQVTVPRAALEGQDWSSRINTLASAHACPAGSSPVVENKLKDDLHSFRGARNLIDHPARGKRDERKRQLQFTERMMQGARLISTLVSLRRSL
jgi:hypothetical protein